MSATSPTLGEITILESGDALSEPLRERLTRPEFERRYRALPQLKKAELIEGVVYVASPVRVSRHGQPHSDIIGWLVAYRSVTPGVMVCDNTTVRLDAENEPQPVPCYALIKPGVDSHALARMTTLKGHQS